MVPKLYPKRTKLNFSASYSTKGWRGNPKSAIIQLNKFKLVSFIRSAIHYQSKLIRRYVTLSANKNISSRYITRKRAIRTISVPRKSYHTNDVFRYLKIWKQKEINVYIVAISLYMKISCYLRIIMLGKGKILDTKKQHLTPNSLSILRPVPVKHPVSRPKLWISFPNYVRNKTSLLPFRNSLKTFLLSLY